MTLLELLVSLAILGLIAGVAGLGWRPAAAPRVTGWHATAAAARRDALAEGRAITVMDTSSDTLRIITALPDGRSLTDSVVPDAR